MDEFKLQRQYLGAMIQTRSDRGRIEHLWIFALSVSTIAASCLLQISPEGGLRLTLPGICDDFRLPEICMSRSLLGISCPGCGLTRSFAAAAKGDFDTAIYFNPMGSVLFILCWIQIPYRIAEYFSVGRSCPFWVAVTNRFDFVLWAVAAGLIGVWVVRLIHHPWV